MQSADVIVIGAGAAGMMCAATAGQAGLRVVLVDHATKLAEKIRISGGGRCNFTNRRVTHENFVSQNPSFCRAALAGYSAQDFIDLVDSHGISWHEKHRGQLFCDDSSEQIIGLLKRLCEAAGVQWRMPCHVQAISKAPDGFVLNTDRGRLRCRQLVIATGGTALPQVGATDFGLRVAKQFGLRIVPTKPALVPLQFDPAVWQPFAELAGLSLQAHIGVVGHRQIFAEDILFTHRGLSGPGVLQISSYWSSGESLQIDLTSGHAIGGDLVARKAGSRQQMSTVLSEYLPKRLVDRWLGGRASSKLAEWSNKAIVELASQLQAWRLMPSGSAGYKKAEVMAGGVDTIELDQRSMMAKSVPGLYFIGEVVDMTGWLGGYNFQWAWSSGVACGSAMPSFKSE